MSLYGQTKQNSRPACVQADLWICQGIYIRMRDIYRLVRNDINYIVTIFIPNFDYSLKKWIYPYL